MNLEFLSFNKRITVRLILRLTAPLILLCATLSFIVPTVMNDIEQNRRQLSIDFAGGNCKWTHAVESSSYPRDSLFGTLFASYPGSGMRVIWQQSEGLTGVMVDDENNIDQIRKNGGIVKTKYPHYEGTWSYGDAMDQVVMVIRNPRWAIASYYHSQYSISSHDSQKGENDEPVNDDSRNMTVPESYQELLDFIEGIELEAKRGKRILKAEKEDWTKWLDLHFEQEINLWAMQIDFYMENGAKYWKDTDVERKGQIDSYRNEEEEHDGDSSKEWPKDEHCMNDITRSCFPVAVIVQERLNNPVTGPSELIKLATVLRRNADESDQTPIIPAEISCIYHETWLNSLNDKGESENSKNNYRDADISIKDLSRHQFTIPQMQRILNKVQELRNKYSSDSRWLYSPVAMDLVSAFDLYLDEILSEFNGLMMKANPIMPPIRSNKNMLYDVAYS